MVFMEQGGSTMGEEPAGLELLLGLLLMAAVPTVVGGAVILSLVGLTMWATAPLRRRGRAKAEDGRAPSGGSYDR
ncbi:hypothetical protein CP972_13065 [Streptomyces prasinus]|uniref:Uncharacterized protein n=2 Tax=Streptomyces TaxID=1883 RepID=A0ABX6B593_9ACTN|nr:hypothetical protein CP972_13065 [Streptomyces prasinus]